MSRGQPAVAHINIVSPRFNQRASIVLTNPMRGRDDRTQAHTSCVPKFSQRTDRVAVRVFERAQQTSQPVTMQLVRDVNEQLSILVDWIEVAIVTRGRGRVGVMPRRGVSRDLQVISG
jgi:hypothetical protein